MAGTVVYEGHATRPRFCVEWGSHETQTWSGKGDSHTDFSAARAEAKERERQGYDTRIIQHGKEVSK